jgi:hypothetical protein
MTNAKRPLPKPARKLGPHGSALWASIHVQYCIEDAGGLETMTLIAQELDRAESCRAKIDKDGELIELPGGGTKEHPLLKRELAARAFVVRGLQRLGLDVEALKPIGRPGLGVGWKGK